MPIKNDIELRLQRGLFLTCFEKFSRHQVTLLTGYVTEQEVILVHGTTPDVELHGEDGYVDW